MAMQLPYHHIRHELDGTSSLLSLSSTAEMKIARLPLHLFNLSNDNASNWQGMMVLDWHHHQEGSDGCTLWYMASQNPVAVAAASVAQLTLRLLFLEQCWCFLIVCKNDGNASVLLSYLSRIWWHILRAITKFSSSNLVAGLKLHLSNWSNADAPYWQVMTMLDYHHRLEDLDGCNLWYMSSRSPVTATSVARLTLHLFFLERCWCSSIVCKNDGNAIAIPSLLSRIERHILCAIMKFNSNDVDCWAEASPLQLERHQCS